MKTRADKKAIERAEQNGWAVADLREDGQTLRSGLTVKGTTAYADLTGLLYDLEKLVPDAVDANRVVEILDDMVRGDCDGLKEDVLQ